MNRFVHAVAAPLLALATIGTQIGWAPTASAQPFVDASSEPTVSPAIDWTQLGLADRLELIGANQPSETAVPVPAGVRPTMLTGQIGSVVNVTKGRVDVLDGRGTLLGFIPVPADVATIPFSIDVSAAEVVDGKAKLSFVLRDANPAANSCTQPPALALSQLAAAFSGATPDPVTVADFLPGFLDHIIIRVGATPTEYQQQAALDLVAKLTRLYRPMPVRIDVAAADAARKPVPSTARVIDIRDGAAPGIAVENAGRPDAVLAITGTGEQLVQQVGLFADRRIDLAQTASAVTVSSHEGAPLTSTVKTFDQLGITGQTTVSGVTTLYAGFDAANFGVGSISGATVHLKASYTPVQGGEGSLLIRSGATVLATHSLDESGTLDITGDVPAEAITSNVGLALELRYISRQECAPLGDRVTFAIDPQSTVTVTPGTVNRGGFPVLPMALTPEFDVALDTPDHLRFAARAVNLMAQQTMVTLRPRVTPFSEAATSGTALLVVTEGRELAEAGMSPPILPGDADTVDVSGATNTDVDVHGPLGLVQAFTHNGRSVLAISGTGDWSLVDADFDYIRGLPNRWGSLTGDVLATGAAGDTVALTVNEGGAMAHQPTPAQGWQWWAWLSAAAVGIAVVAAGATMLVRRRVRES